MPQFHPFPPLCAVVLAALFGSAMPARAQAPSSAGPVAAAVIDDLIMANHILAAEGVLDAYGHVSIRHPGDPNRYLTSRLLAPALVKAEDIMEFDLDSKPVDQRGRVMYSERFIHGEIYKARPDVKAVVHSHSPTVVPFGISGVPLRPVFHLGAFLYRGVPVFEIREANDDGEMLVRDGKIGAHLAKVLGDKDVVLMRGHGDAVVGPTLQHAVFRAIYTEVNARLQATALALGGGVNYLTDKEGDWITNRRPGNIMRAWELWRSKIATK
jgi:ribulose-5-phosphate 4-epimerase/fuculose-1-phosphate aldolase